MRLREAYSLISRYYGLRCAKRSGLPYINHIKEGLDILTRIGASEDAKDAYCIHPLLQNDEDLLKNLDEINDWKIDPRVLILAMEYRWVANNYLSHREVLDPSEIALSALKEVNDMLIADKVQNYKDFKIYHQKTNPRSKELTIYFENWLHVLGVDAEGNRVILT